MDRDNRVALNSIEGAMNVIDKNSLGNIGTRKSVQIQDEKSYQTVEKGIILSCTLN